MSDPRAAMLRVNQAGEFGATRIYAGQLAVMGDRGPHAGEIAAMAAQEAVHRERFDALLVARGVRPTVLQPLWAAAGFALGEDPELGAMIREFRDDEREHRETALAAGAERAPAYPLLFQAIRMGCRAAIAVSKHI